MFLESTLLHPVWWSLGWSLSLKTAYVHISILDSTIILDLYHVCLSIAVSRYANFAFISSMFWMVPGEAWDVLCAKSLHFWNIPGEDLINQTVSTFLFVYLFISLSWECTFLVRLIWLLPGLSHQYSKVSTVVMLLYHGHDTMSSFWQVLFHAQAEVIMSTQLQCLCLLEFTQCANCHVLS